MAAETQFRDKTSRALVAAVPDHELTVTFVEEPESNDFRLSMEVAAVSSRRCTSVLPIFATTTGNTSHFCSGISSLEGAAAGV
jgi:hypothetical protein